MEFEENSTESSWDVEDEYTEVLKAAVPKDSHTFVNDFIVKKKSKEEKLMERIEEFVTKHNAIKKQSSVSLVKDHDHLQIPEIVSWFERNKKEQEKPEENSNPVYIRKWSEISKNMQMRSSIHVLKLLNTP